MNKPRVIDIEARRLDTGSEAGEYDPGSKLLHWSIALAVLAMLVFGFYLDTLAFSEGKVALIQQHKSSGMVLALFMLFRIARRARHGFLPSTENRRGFRSLAARGVHVLLLLLPVGMVVSGVLRSLAYGRSVKVFGAEFIPAVMEKNDQLHAVASDAHAVIAWLLLACIAMHVTAALWHHFVTRDETLRRMLPGRSSKPSAALAEIAR
ncbi:MAG: cytochrome b [Pseudomonadota bacterium]